MSNKTPKYLTVGEVADILGVNKNTILHYDREGLIKSTRLENNYRYFHENQAQNFKAILELRKMGFSIEKTKEIKELILAKKYNEITTLIKERQEECKAEIREIEKNLERLKNHEKYVEYLDGLVNLNSENISIDATNYKIFRKDEEIFSVKEYEEGHYAVFYTSGDTSEEIAIKNFYEKICDNNYKTIGNMSVENVYLNENKPRIKILKVQINPLTSE